MLWGLALALPFIISQKSPISAIFKKIVGVLHKKIADFGDFHNPFLPHMNRNDYRANCYVVT